MWAMSGDTEMGGGRTGDAEGTVKAEDAVES